MRVAGYRELEATCGDELRGLVSANPSGFLLAKALLARVPPVQVSKDVVNTWLTRYGGLQHLKVVETAGLFF